MSIGTFEEIDRQKLVNLAIYDFHEAIDRGESPDPAGWAARYPEIAAELRSYFDDLRALRLLNASPPGFSRDEPGPGGPEPRPMAAELQPGDRLGDYVLLEKIGKGGQGEVWKASPVLAPNTVLALKTLRGTDTNDPVAIAQLRWEANAISRMRHPHIIPMFFFGEDHGRWYFVMELMEGRTIADRLESYQADPRSAVVLLEKIAGAIHHAHSRRLVHRDLKPSNVPLTEEGEPKVSDFGLSARYRVIEEAIRGERSECPGEPGACDDTSWPFAQAGIVGTIPYMSPEMADGRWADVLTASDVYGLGAILYTMLTGRPPFRGRDVRETLTLVIQGNPTSPRAINRKVDRELAAVCLKCLHRDPGGRYGSANELANDLRRWLGRRPTLAGGKPSVGRELRFWVRRHPLRLALASVAALALWLAGLAISVSESRAENAREAARLANDVNRDLNLIRRAARIWASDPRLQAAFATSRAQQHAIQEFLKIVVEKENLFDIVGRNPLVNVFVLDSSGILLADTMVSSPYVGKNYQARDYFRSLLMREEPWDRAYVARSYLSTKDAHYKTAVSTRIRDGSGKLLGVLVANVPIGPRLIDVDLGHEPGEAAILCPVDQSDPFRGVVDSGRLWEDITALDGHYTEHAKNHPFQMDPSHLPDFQNNPELDHATVGPWGGQLVDYHRVGQTPLIVVMRRKCPWPLSWFSLL